jgi:hypothetical protein
MNSNFIYKQTQKSFTEDEKNRLLKAGMIFLSLDQYKKMLFTFGLRLETKNTHKYYNNLNPHIGSWLECGPEAIDETGFSFANIYGKFYQEERNKETQKYKDFREFRQNYFTQLKSGHLINL